MAFCAQFSSPDRMGANLCPYVNERISRPQNPLPCEHLRIIRWISVHDLRRRGATQTGPNLRPIIKAGQHSFAGAAAWRWLRNYRQQERAGLRTFVGRMCPDEVTIFLVTVTVVMTRRKEALPPPPWAMPLS
jgi:hypothetical protein